MNSVADLFAANLAAAGISRVFGLPGGASLPLLAALKRRGIDFVLVRNESSAVYMAGVTARLTGRPGVCLVTLGPGAANAMAGVAHAYLDREPVLLVSADFPRAAAGRYTHQLLDLEALFRPVTKRTFRLEPERAGPQLRQALALTLSGRPGPVHLSLTGSDAEQAVADFSVDEFRIEIKPTPNNPTITQKIIGEARRPLILAGLGLEPEGPYEALRELAEALGAPVVDTPKSKGALPADHPLFVGTIGLMQSDPAYALLDEADCLIAVGFDVVELVRPWDYTVPLIWLANWENEDPVIPAAASLVGPLLPHLRQLSDGASRSEAGWGAARVSRFKTEQAGRTLPAPAPGRLLPQQLLASLREALPPSTPLATDVGSHKILTALAWPALRPNRYFVSNGLSAMGFGLPAALAAALALGESAVCLTGDAGFSMISGELSLIQEHQLPVVVIVMNDAALDLIRAKQLRRQEAVYGTEFHNPDFAALARAYALPYFRVDDAAGARQQLAGALASGGPALVEALIDPVSYPTSPGQPGTP